ncbi:hypothetical protein C8Q76DRAFT_629597, partial [Earliella scabrosa]
LDDEDLHEAWIIVSMSFRISHYSASPLFAFPDRPTIHLAGDMGGVGRVGSVDVHDNNVRRVHGAVSMLPDGSVRWSLMSTAPNSTEDEWASEAVQLGGVGSAMGSIGMWTGAQLEDGDPLGMSSLSFCSARRADADFAESAPVPGVFWQWRRCGETVAYLYSLPMRMSSWLTDRKRCTSSLAQDTSRHCQRQSRTDQSLVAVCPWMTAQESAESRGIGRSWAQLLTDKVKASCSYRGTRQAPQRGNT